MIFVACCGARVRAAGLASGGWACYESPYLCPSPFSRAARPGLGLLGTSVEVVQQLAAVVIIPVFLSNGLVPAGTMPAWLRVIAANQPLSQAIDCIRDLLAGVPAGDHLELAITELAGIIVIAFAAETALFRRRIS